MSRGLAVATRGGSDGLQILSVGCGGTSPSYVSPLQTFTFSTIHCVSPPPPSASTIGQNGQTSHTPALPSLLSPLGFTSLSSGANTLASLPVSAPLQSLAGDLTLISRFSPNLSLVGWLVVAFGPQLKAPIALVAEHWLLVLIWPSSSSVELQLFFLIAGPAPAPCLFVAQLGGPLTLGGQLRVPLALGGRARILMIICRAQLELLIPMVAGVRLFMFMVPELRVLVFIKAEVGLFILMVGSSGLGPWHYTWPRRRRVRGWLPMGSLVWHFLGTESALMRAHPSLSPFDELVHPPPYVLPKVEAN
nr:hypothetical protein Iba_chr14aCG7620 [Ipomoea batatas]